MRNGRHHSHLPHRAHPPGHTAPVRTVVDHVQERAQGLRERVQGFHRGHRGRSPLDSWLARAARSRASAAPWFRHFHAYVEEQIAQDGGEEFLHDLKATVAEKARRLHGVMHVANRIALRFRPPVARQRFISEVLLPARCGEIDSVTAWLRTDAIAGMAVLETVHSHTPGWTIGIGIGGLAGLGVGLEGTLGLCGALSGTSTRVSGWYTEGNIVAGTVVDIDGTVHVQFAPGTPQTFGGGAVTGELGAGYYVAGAVSIGLIPTFHRPGLLSPMVTWAFNSVTLQAGAGMGGDATVGVGWGLVMPFGSNQVWGLP